MAKSAKASLIVVSCAEALIANKSAAIGWREAAAGGPAGAIVSHACILNAVMRKVFDHSEHHVQAGEVEAAASSSSSLPSSNSNIMRRKRGGGK